MNPRDNIANLSEGYIQTLESMSEAKRRRFLLGEYSDDSDKALWRREWIYKNRISHLPEFDKIAVAVDPAVSSSDTSCETGIIIGGKYTKDNQEYYCIIDDLSQHGTVTAWGQIVAEAFTKYGADVIVGEVNNGGDLVEANIRNYDKNIKYESVRATRGKAVRAEPIADLYRRGLVSHYGEMSDLENQLCEWTEESDVSPDRMDALVWLISYLSGITTGQLQALNIKLWR
jgi:phage terminase large subunit-like protein